MIQRRLFLAVLLTLAVTAIFSCVGCVDQSGYELPNETIISQDEYDALSDAEKAEAVPVEYTGLDPNLTGKVQSYSIAVKNGIDAGSSSGLIPQPFGIIGTGAAGLLAALAGLAKGAKWKKNAVTAEDKFANLQTSFQLANSALTNTVAAIDKFKDDSKKTDSGESWSKLKGHLSETQDRQEKSLISTMKT